MAQNSFLRWLGCGILALILWLFFPFLKSFLCCPFDGNGRFSATSSS
ncbi:hypothetical protein [Sulfurospirillum diekertiae]|nr:hypothetical protein [Sulfurospirillum diekertiae]